MYTGEPIENPVAERTKNIQEWNVLTSWRKSIKGPMTFAHLAKKWAPSSRRYGRDIDGVAQRFFDGACNDPDPAPELVAEARKGRTPTQAAVASTDAATVGDTLARKANDKAKEERAPRAGLGGVSLVAADAAKTVPPAVAETGSLKILNAGADAKPEVTANLKTKADAKADETTSATATDKNDKEQAATAKRDGKTEVAALATTAKPQNTPAKADTPAKKSNCRVWTASYGGTKAVIIKANANELTNFTVLDVNDGREEKKLQLTSWRMPRAAKRSPNSRTPTKRSIRRSNSAPKVEYGEIPAPANRGRSVYDAVKFRSLCPWHFVRAGPHGVRIPGAPSAGFRRSTGPSRNSYDCP